MENQLPKPSPVSDAEKKPKAQPEVTFDEDHCKGCELCVAVCPKKVLRLDTSRVNCLGYYPAVIFNQAECIGCASCAKICPDSVITVRK